MNVSQQIDKYIEEVGKGSIRDALNIALAENARLAADLTVYKDALAQMQTAWTPQPGDVEIVEPV
jgi:hypothetical protein